MNLAYILEEVAEDEKLTFVKDFEGSVGIVCDEVQIFNVIKLAICYACIGNNGCEIRKYVNSLFDVSRNELIDIYVWKDIKY